MNESYLRNVLEAAMLAAGRPLPLAEFAQLFEESSRPSSAELRAALAALEADYESRGIELKETGNGFRIQVRRALATEVSKLWPERPPRYSRALLETLALIAYRQPITRGEIEAVRGVAVNPQIVKALLERNWVRVVGQRDVPGRPELLGTTREFLDYFGLKTLDELPPLSELQAVGDFNLQLDLNGTPSAVEVSNSQSASALADENGVVNDSGMADESSAHEDVGVADESALSVEEDSADEEEISAAAQTSSELVAAGRDIDE